MNSLLQFATKYFPELEKVAEGGDSCSKDEDEFMKLIQSLKTKKGRKSSALKRPKKKLHRRNNHPRLPPHPRWYPLKKKSLDFPPRMTFPVPFHPRPRPIIKPLKTGTVIGNVSSALETFKKKRDKFLVYLQQLQKELTELNLPSLSTEDMIQKRRRRSKKEDSQKEKTESKGGIEKKGRLGPSAELTSVRSQPTLRKKKITKKKKRQGHSEQLPKQVLGNISKICIESSSSSLWDL